MDVLADSDVSLNGNAMQNFDAKQVWTVQQYTQGGGRDFATSVAIELNDVQQTSEEHVL